MTTTDETLPPWVDDDILPVPTETWAISSLGEAEWAAAHWAAAKEAIVSAHHQAEEWRARIDDWEAEACKRHYDTTGFFAGALEDYARRLRAEDPRAKTLTLPSVVVKSVSRPPRVVVSDEQAVIDWAIGADRSEVVKVVQSIRLSELRHALVVDDAGAIDPESGEKVPGVDIEAESVSVSISVVKRP